MRRKMSRNARHIIRGKADNFSHVHSRRGEAGSDIRVHLRIAP